MADTAKFEVGKWVMEITAPNGEDKITFQGDSEENLMEMLKNEFKDWKVAEKK